MAIIAILATAGLSAYTGYIKKARDTTRIADLAAINTIVLSSLSVSWMAPTKTELEAAILAANNNKEILDPLMDPSSYDTKEACWLDLDYWTVNHFPCLYTYSRCDSGTWYILTALFESLSNATALYDNDIAGPGAGLDSNGNYIGVYSIEDAGLYPYWQDQTYDIGSCRTYREEDASNLPNLFYPVTGNWGEIVINS